MTETSITIAHLTDPHLLGTPEQEMLGINTFDHLQTVIGHIANATDKATHLLATGDIAQSGVPQAYAHFLGMTASLGIPVHALPGNHDHPEHFRSVLGTLADPVVDMGPWRLVMLNSQIPGETGGHLPEDQLDLLEQAAQVEPGRHVLVAMHHQPIPIGSAWLDTMMITNGHVLFDMLKRLPRVRALLWGHIHQAYDVEIPHPASPDQDLQLLATPATCFQFMPGSKDFAFDDIAPGYRWLYLHDDGKIGTRIERVASLTRRPPSDIRGY